jgi:hypothetical protein
VEYSSKVQHLGTCPHGRIHAAADPGNWIAENLNMAQINNLIRRATARLDNPAPQAPAAHFPAPQLPVMGQFHIPPIPPIPAIPPFNNQQPPAPGPAFIGMFNFFDWVGGGGGGGAPASH